MWSVTKKKNTKGLDTSFCVLILETLEIFVSNTDSCSYQNSYCVHFYIFLNGSAVIFHLLNETV